jgi:hypothetical protein
MRPSTLSQAFERVAGGEPLSRALAEVLDEFYLQPDREGRSRVLADAPPPTGDARLDALAGGMAEYLAKGFDAEIPTWAGEPHRYLREPWYTVPEPRPGLIEFLVYSSPAELRSRNIFTESRPFRRASQALRSRLPVDG